MAPVTTAGTSTVSSVARVEIVTYRVVENTYNDVHSSACSRQTIDMYALPSVFFLLSYCCFSVILWIRIFVSDQCLDQPQPSSSEVCAKNSAVQSIMISVVSEVDRECAVVDYSFS